MSEERKAEKNAEYDTGNQTRTIAVRVWEAVNGFLLAVVGVAQRLR